MKKIYIYFAIALFAITLNTSVSIAQTFEKGTKLASLGLGLGNAYGLGFGSPSIVGAFDMGVSPKLGIGYIGVGGIVGFSAGSTDYFYAKVSYTNFSLAFRATYHFDLDVEKLDLYGGVLAGYNIGSSSTSYKGSYLSGYNYDSPAYGGVILGGFAGARYYFNPKFSGFAELSNSISWTTIGLSLKF